MQSSTTQQVEIPCIAGLDSAIPSVREFPLRCWYYASQLWYYHGPRNETGFRPDRRFFELVDPELRELCSLLLSAGLRTTPSCQGHFHPREHFARIWDQLAIEERSICGPGLFVRDCETDRLLLFRDGAYRVAWADFSHFCEQASSVQHRGYLGVLVPHAAIRERLDRDRYATAAARVEFDERVSRALACPAYACVVEASGPAACHREWRALTGYFRAVLAAR